MLKHGIESKMSYSQSESDFSFVINSVPDFYSDSDSESNSDFSSASINLTIFTISFLYLHSSK